MMTLTSRIATALLRVRWPTWEDACPAGPPVPDAETCTECDAFLLADLQPGAAATVSCLLQPAEPAAARLGALGLLPGVRVTVVQRSPVHVVRIGYTEIAMDRVLAGLVRVRPDDTASPATGV